MVPLDYCIRFWHSSQLDATTSWPRIEKAATRVKQAINADLPGSFKEVEIA